MSLDFHTSPSTMWTQMAFPALIKCQS